MIYYLLAVIKTRSVHFVSLTATSAIKHKNHTRYMTDVSSRTDSTLLDCTKIHMSQFGTQNLYAIYMKSFQGWLPTCEYTKLFTQFTLHTMSLPTEYILPKLLSTPNFVSITTCPLPLPSTLLLCDDLVLRGTQAVTCIIVEWDYY